MLTLHYAPKTRATRMLWLLEEIGQPYDVKVVDFASDPPEYRRIHPLGKVPALQHGDEIVFESAAICVYLADAFPQAGLAPKIGEPGRGAFLSWLAFNAGVIEPASFGQIFKHETNPRMVGWGRWEDAAKALRAKLEAGPYVLGDRFSAADVLITSSIQMAGFGAGLLPKEVPFTDYVERCTARPAYARGQAKEAALVAG